MAKKAFLWILFVFLVFGYLSDYSFAESTQLNGFTSNISLIQLNHTEIYETNTSVTNTKTNKTKSIPKIVFLNKSHNIKKIYYHQEKYKRRPFHKHQTINITKKKSNIPKNITNITPILVPKIISTPEKKFMLNSVSIVIILVILSIFIGATTVPKTIKLWRNRPIKIAKQENLEHETVVDKCIEMLDKGYKEETVECFYNQMTDNIINLKENQFKVQEQEC